MPFSHEKQQPSFPGQNITLNSRRRIDFTDASQLSALLGHSDTRTLGHSRAPGVSEQFIIQRGVATGIGQLVDVDMETVRFQQVELNMPWIRSIAPTQHWLTIIVPLCSGPRPLFNGRRVQSAQVALIGPNTERFEIIEEATTGKYFEISLYAGRLQMEYLRAFGTTAPNFEDLCEVIDIPMDLDAWIQSVEAIGRMVTASSSTIVPIDADLDAVLVRIILMTFKVVADLELRRGTILPGALDRKHREALWLCRKYIHEHIEQTLGIEELSAASGYSERQLQHLWKLRLGIAPLEYVRDYRFQKARDALKLWAGSVKEAALSCGFSELGRFSVKYRHVFGESPHETLRWRTAPRASEGTTPSSINRSSDESFSVRAESKMRAKNTSAEALESGWRSGVPSSKNTP